MNKFDYIESIIDFVRGKTGANFQLCVGDILSTYYSFIGKKFEMPDYFGGDDKNDGWVVGDGVFYQIYAPTRLKTSLSKDLQTKFEDDLEGLLKKLHEGKWEGIIKEFIFIANTFDNNLPHDSDRFFDNTVDKLKTEFSCDFKYRLVNVTYLHDVLSEISDLDKLESLTSKLKVRTYIDPNIVTEKMMIDLITEISGNINRRILEKDRKNSYNRISSPRKIRINHLNEKKDEIENILLNLDTVEDAVTIINQDVFSEDDFFRVKNFVIDLYEKLAKNLSGGSLYEGIIKQVLENVDNKSAFNVSAKFLVVYIFDKCDIFEKE